MRKNSRQNYLYLQMNLLFVLIWDDPDDDIKKYINIW